LPSRRFLIDGEGVVEGAGGIADFALLHSRQHDARCYGFDLLQLGSKDLRPLPLAMRKDLLAKLRGALLGGSSIPKHLDVARTCCRPTYGA
jgi:ATP-dependent DNA ligase